MAHLAPRGRLGWRVHLAPQGPSACRADLALLGCLGYQVRRVRPANQGYPCRHHRLSHHPAMAQLPKFGPVHHLKPVELTVKR